MKKVYLLFSLIALFAVAGLAQSPNTLRQKCHNSSTYGQIQITGVGDININPCSGKTTTFTGFVTLPAGSQIISGGLTGNPNLAFLTGGGGDTASVTLNESTKTITVGNSGGDAILNESSVINHKYSQTITAPGTTGAQTINKVSGAMNIAAGQSSIVLTDSSVGATTLPFYSLGTADGTCTFVKSAVVNAGAHTVTFTVNAGCTAETRLNFFITN